MLPVTKEGVRRYLGSGLIKGIGPVLAERIVATFGEEALEIIDKHPERLLEVPDIGEKRMKVIVDAWEAGKHVREIMLFLYGHRISTNLAVKIYKTYGENAIRIVTNDPYRLADDIFGVGFKTADRIAQDLGLPKEHPRRLEAGVVYALNQAAANGDVFLPKSVLVRTVKELLGIDEGLIAPAIDRLQERELVVVEDVPRPMVALKDDERETSLERQTAVYLALFYYSEKGIAEKLATLLKHGRSRLRDCQALLLPETGLSEKQQQAVMTALKHPVSILTGGPGTGKTTTVRALIAVLEASKKTYALASPTGRAAKRLSEATGRPASTIHRLLKYKPGEGFGFNEGNMLKVDFLVVDEASMLDLMLMYHLLKAVSPGTHLLFVGDVDQLPSVGAGDVLRDLIASDSVKLTRLTEIYRQVQGSQIIVNAHRINQGKMPNFPRTVDVDAEIPPDFFLFPANDAETAAKWILDVVVERVPHTFKFHPLRDIQVLAPMYRGAVGVTALNKELQEKLNPPTDGKVEVTIGGRIFRQGDKVMQIQNDYEKDVYNGDIGFVRHIYLIDQTLEVDFDGRLVTYEWSACDKLVHAYAISVHKSQGSEFPVVVMPVVTQHYLMLQRNLLYTAVTRARALCILVGSKKAIGIAVRNDKTSKRYTALAWRISEEVNSED